MVQSTCPYFRLLRTVSPVAAIMIKARLQPTRYQISATGLRLVEGRMKEKCNRLTDFSIFRTFLNKIAKLTERYANV